MLTQTEIVVDTALDNSIAVGDSLKGVRTDNTYMAQNIRQRYMKIGDGTCTNKKKKVDLYKSNAGLLYGLSTILPYRYFILRNEGNGGG